MYDIVSMMAKGDTLSITCIHDGSEDDLLTVMHQVFTGPVNHEQTTLPIVQFATLMFVKPHTEIDVTRVSSGYSPIMFYIFSVKTFLQALDSPPPRS